MFRATQLMILGCTHLGRGEQLEPDQAIEGVVDLIVHWGPDAIAIEALPGELIDSYMRLAGPFADVQVGGLPQAAACAEAVRGLHHWDLWEARTIGADASRTRTERVIAWCAAYEPYTALLIAGRDSSCPAGVRGALDDVAARGDERSRIAGEAAARLGLERLYPFDDHSNWAAFLNVAEARFEEFIQALHGKASAHPLVARGDAEVARALKEGDIWSLWLDRNSPGVVAASDDLESGYFLKHGHPEELARKALAGWRTRNLLMAGRLRAVTGEHPGGRVLALVGHAHKGPLEAALATDQWDVEIADVSELDQPV